MEIRTQHLLYYQTVWQHTKKYLQNIKGKQEFPLYSLTDRITVKGCKIQCYNFLILVHLFAIYNSYVCPKKIKL